MKGVPFVNRRDTIGGTYSVKNCIYKRVIKGFDLGTEPLRIKRS